MTKGAWNIVYASAQSCLEGTQSLRMSKNVQGESRMKHNAFIIMPCVTDLCSTYIAPLLHI